MSTFSDDELQQDPTIAHIVINVLDENDNAPQFENSNYYAGPYTMRMLSLKRRLVLRIVNYISMNFLQV